MAPVEPTGILETALYAADLDAAADFYGRVIGLTERTRAEGRHVFFICGRGMLLIFRAEATRVAGGPLPVPTHGAEGEGHVCFSVPGEALDGWAAHLAAEGFSVEADFRWPGSGARSVYVRDPAGNSVEFAEPKLWGLV
jgi:catechol 2,3-dioxygenase-like lactoylglutathione lyase family enzyme